LLRNGCSTTFKVRRSKRYSHGKEEQAVPGLVEIRLFDED
jgi:hypothetical protein